jgi:hypothetical protein
MRVAVIAALAVLVATLVGGSSFVTSTVTIDIIAPNPITSFNTERFLNATFAAAGLDPAATYYDITSRYILPNGNYRITLDLVAAANATAALLALSSAQRTALGIAAIVQGPPPAPPIVPVDDPNGRLTVAVIVVVVLFTSLCACFAYGVWRYTRVDKFAPGPVGRAFHARAPTEVDLGDLRDRARENPTEPLTPYTQLSYGSATGADTATL